MRILTCKLHRGIKPRINISHCYLGRTTCSLDGYCMPWNDLDYCKNYDQSRMHKIAILISKEKRKEELELVQGLEQLKTLH